MTNNMPIDVLEAHAETQRKQLHNDVAQLRAQLREKLEPKRLAREYVAPASGIAALVGLVLGYGVAGIFTRE